MRDLDADAGRQLGSGHRGGADQRIAIHTARSLATFIVNTTYLGGGLGRKIEQDYVSQAIQVALAVKRPVKLTWTREEDMAHDNYRPMAAVRVQAALSGSAITAWSLRNVSAAILGQRGWMAPGSVDGQAVEGAVNLPYNLGTSLTEWVPLPAGIPIGFWRSVGSSINTFAVECTIDELAQKAGLDPFTFRYNLISDPRRLAVLQAADNLSLWRNSLPSGHSWGMAMAEWNGTIVCEVAEVSNPRPTSLRGQPRGVRGRLRPGHQSQSGRGANAGRHRARLERGDVGTDHLHRRQGE